MRDVLIRAGQVFMFSLLVLQASAQQEGFLLSGRVLDAQSKEPVSIASLQDGRELVLTNVKGEFKVKVKPGDRLLVSHTAYEPISYVVEAGSSSIEILLVEKMVELSEVEVSSFISEGQFKEEVLNAVPKYDYEHKVAARNMQMVNQIVPLGYAPDFNPYGLFKDATSVDEVSLFSTNPSMGLLKALKQMGQRRTFKPPPSPMRPSGEPVHGFGIHKRKNGTLYNQE